MKINVNENGNLKGTLGVSNFDGINNDKLKII